MSSFSFFLQRTSFIFLISASIPSLPISVSLFLLAFSLHVSPFFPFLSICHGQIVPPFLVPSLLSSIHTSDSLFLPFFCFFFLYHCHRHTYWFLHFSFVLPSLFTYYIFQFIFLPVLSFFILTYYRHIYSFLQCPSSRSFHPPSASSFLHSSPSFFLLCLHLPPLSLFLQAVTFISYLSAFLPLPPFLYIFHSPPFPSSLHSQVGTGARFRCW